MNSNNQTLFGFPVVITDTIPVGEILLDRFPTWQEVALYGSLEAAIEAQEDQWTKLNISTTDDTYEQK